MFNRVVSCVYKVLLLANARRKGDRMYFRGERGREEEEVRSGKCS